MPEENFRLEMQRGAAKIAASLYRKIDITP
jgi:hypothetical protein